MTKEEILENYKNILATIEEKGIDWYKEYINEKKNDLPLSTLTIASSIIAVYDILGEK